MKLQTLLPLLVSMGVLTAVAILQRSSRLAAAMTATMPLTIPLGYWIVVSASGDAPQAAEEFTRGLVWAIWPTVVFVFVIWLAARAGWRMTPTLMAGYLAWGLGLLVVMGVRRLVGA